MHVSHTSRIGLQALQGGTTVKHWLEQVIDSGEPNGCSHQRHVSGKLCPQGRTVVLGLKVRGMVVVWLW
jgi:hypothetical protein